MALLQLPNELLLQVATSLHDPCDLKSLLTSNRRLYHLLSPEFANAFDRYESGGAGNIQQQTGDLWTHWPNTGHVKSWISLAIDPPEQRAYILSNLLWLAVCQDWTRLALSLLKKGGLHFPTDPLRIEATCYYGSQDIPTPPPTGAMCALAMAAWRGNAALIEPLLDHGAHINESSAYFWWRAHHQNGNLEFYPKSILGLAVLGRHAGLVDTLIRRGADVDKYAQPVRYACHNRDARVLEALLRAGAGSERASSADYTLNMESTPLRVAAEKGCVGCVEVLLRYGTDARESLDACVVEDFGPGHEECLRMLLRGGGNLGATRFWRTGGNTALHIAASMGLESAVGILLAAGADMEKLNDGGRTATEEAEYWFGMRVRS